MFLSMMTADAAAQHGHEFSPPRSGTPTRGSPISLPSLSFLTAAARQRPPATPLPPSVLKPSSPDDNNHNNTRTKAQKSIMFAEPEALGTDTKDLSRPASLESLTSADDKSKKRPPRSKTTYNLAHPPPGIGARHKLHLRPKVLLQLQQVSASRPKPAFEVIPSTTFVPRLARKFARAVKSRDKLGPDDVVVVKAEDYGPTVDNDSSDEEGWGSREVIGVVCAGKKDEGKGCVKTQICMDDGSAWEATRLTNGGYEFVFTDEHGLQLKARWVARLPLSRRKSGTFQNQASASGSSSGGGKFNFSTISHDSRRHPIIASMTRTSIDIMDYYSMPSSSTSFRNSMSNVHTTVQNPVQTPSIYSDASSFMEAGEQQYDHGPIQTDEVLRKLIIVTGVWVAFRENWSSVFRYGTTANCNPIYISTNLTRPSGPTRAVSMPFEAASSASSTPDGDARRTFKLLRSGTSILHRNTASTVSSASAPSTPASLPPASKPRARRSNSTGTAFMQRASTSRPRLRSGLYAEDNALAESENEREMSRELDRKLTLQTTALNQESNITTMANPPPIHIAAATPDQTPTSSPVRSSRVQSAYYPTDPSAGLWDRDQNRDRERGDPNPSTDASAGKLCARMRPKSVDGAADAADEKHAKRRSGRFRRMFGVFRKGNGG